MKAESKCSESSIVMEVNDSSVYSHVVNAKRGILSKKCIKQETKYLDSN